LLADGVISTRGLQSDVNTAYSEGNGGYKFAKRFYKEAYRLAVKEAGDERLMAVIEDIMRQPPEIEQQPQQVPYREKSIGCEI
jgi:hypothetical protein